MAMITDGLCAISTPVLLDCASLVSELLPLGSVASACKSPPTISVVIGDEHELAAVIAAATDVSIPVFVREFGGPNALAISRADVVVEMRLHPYRSASRAVSFLDTLLMIQVKSGRLTDLQVADIDRRLDALELIVAQIERADPCGLSMWEGLPTI